VAESAPIESAAPGRDGARYRLYGVERALDTLELLAAAGPGGMTLTELAERISVSKSSAFALLQTLIARGFVADSGTRLSRRYRLGMALAKLGDAAEVQSPLVSMALPVLQSLTDSTGLTTRLVVPDGPYAVVAARVDAPGTVRFASYLGKREYPHCTSAGKALLAALPREQARALAEQAGMPARTERTITDPDALLRDLEVSAARGYAIDDEEDCEGVFCVGAAIFDRNGDRIAAISGTGLKLNRPTWQMDELGVSIRKAADQITDALGGPSFADRQRTVPPFTSPPSGIPSSPSHPSGIPPSPSRPSGIPPSPSHPPAPESDRG
jgi:IclR family transcriptional regulator, acetate operon repressor